MDSLTFGQRHKKGQTLKNGSTIADRKYLDFIISGQSLGQLFGLTDGDLIGTFGWMVNKEYENKLIDEFLGLVKPELETGRTSFYVCPECGDIGCGAITAKIITTDSKVIWQDFGYENNYSEPDLTNYKHVGPFSFDKTEYRDTFVKLKG
ncbi:MAG TPA: hypothetical protein VF411_15980 [Bacteroidia bacterium]